MSLSNAPAETVPPVLVMAVPSRSSCRFDKFIYDARNADKEYRTMLVDARARVNLTTTEANQIASIIKPLLVQGLSPYRIVAIHVRV